MIQCKNPIFSLIGGSEKQNIGKLNASCNNDRSQLLENQYLSGSNISLYQEIFYIEGSKPCQIKSFTPTTQVITPVFAPGNILTITTDTTLGSIF